MQALYTKRITAHFGHESPYHVEIDGHVVVITNGASYDEREEVRLSVADQRALLALLADKFGYTLV